MKNISHINRCILNTVEGLAAGLCHFSPPSRVALVYALNKNEPLRVYDPQNLLGGHEPRLKELFLDSSHWKKNFLDNFGEELLVQIRHEDYVHPLSGIISFCGQSRPLFLQMWCTEQHPDICCVGPTERWLEYAARLLSRNVAAKRMLDLGTSDYVLKEYAMHAVRDHIVDERNRVLGLDTHLRIFPILDAILDISKTREEGSWPRGSLFSWSRAILARSLSSFIFPARNVRNSGMQNTREKCLWRLKIPIENSYRTANKFSEFPGAKCPRGVCVLISWVGTAS